MSAQKIKIPTMKVVVVIPNGFRRLFSYERKRPGDFLAGNTTWMRIAVAGDYSMPGAIYIRRKPKTRKAK